MKEKINLKWLNKLTTAQLIKSIETQKRYLSVYLKKENRDFARSYINYMFKYINTARLILKSRKVNA